MKSKSDRDEAWDYVIVGGGSAGCVLANRLSADPDTRVLLIEAGRDVKPGEEGSAILDTYPGRAAFDPRNHWPDLKVQTRPNLHNAPERPTPRQYEQPRIMGGGSTINGQVANRGTPEDYDEWASLGAVGWDWQGVLPYFVRLERDLDFSGPLHGTGGPIPICRIPREQWPSLSHATEAAFAEVGLPDIADQNGVYTDGSFPITLSNEAGRHRVSTAMAYLDRATRARPNLGIMADAQATRLMFEGRRVVAVEAVRHGRTERLPCHEAVLAAGALHSPAILMRSGVGPAGDLAGLGIDVVADVQGVGRNLQEHPGIALSAFIRPHARLRHTRRHIHVAARYSSGAKDCPSSDMFAMMAAKSAWHPLGRRIATLIVWVNKAFARGSVSLVSADPLVPPTADLNFLGDARDIERLAGAARFMAGVMATDALSNVAGPPVLSSYSGFAKSLGRQSLGNYLITAPVAAAIDLAPPLRRAFFRNAVGGGISLRSVLADDEALASYVKDNAFGQWHVCGTCRMGRTGDPDTVVDARTGRVEGLGGVRVADASIMPTAPRANLNIPVIMAAEKMADLIVGQR